MDLEKIVIHSLKLHGMSNEEINDILSDAHEFMDSNENLLSFLPDFLTRLNQEIHEANNYFAEQRWNFIQIRIQILKDFLIYKSDNDEINSILSMYRQHFIDHYKFWGTELYNMPDNNFRIKKADANYKLEIIEEYFNYLHNNIIKIEHQKLIISPATKSLINDAIYMLNNIKDVIEDYQRKKIFKSIYNTSIIVKKRLEKEEDKNFMAEVISIAKDGFSIDNSNTERKSDGKCLSTRTIEFNSNNFNQEGAELFEYLVQEYIDIHKKRGLKRRFTNVWYFMKNDISKKSKYKIYLIMRNYIAFVKDNFGLVIKNTNKAILKYDEEKEKLHNHVIEFESKNCK